MTTSGPSGRSPRASAAGDSARAARRPRRDTVRRRAELERHARTEFLTSGLNGARMKDIAEAANVTEAVLYRYFPSKNELFDAAVLQPLTEYLDRLYPAGANAIVRAPHATDRAQVIDELSHGWLDALNEMLPLLGLALFSDRAKGERFYLDHLYPVLAKAIAAAPTTLQGWGRDDVDPEVLLLSIFWSHLGIALDQQIRGRTKDPGTLVQAITDLVVHGVSPRQSGPPDGSPPVTS